MGGETRSSLAGGGRYNLLLVYIPKNIEDDMSANPHEEGHSGPIRNPKQFLVAVFLSFVIPVLVIIGLVMFVTSANKPGPGAGDPAMAKAQRLQKVGHVEIRDANRPLRGGEAVYTTQCAACHAAGAAGAPKFQDTAAWGPRLAHGFEALVAAAIKGKGAMPPQVGEFNDTEIARGVVFMANAAGAKFDEPQAPAPAADAAAAGSAAPGTAAPGAAAPGAAAPDAAASAAAAPGTAASATAAPNAAAAKADAPGAGVPRGADSVAGTPAR
jgi:cytochrome c5